MLGRGVLVAFLADRVPQICQGCLLGTACQLPVLIWRHMLYASDTALLNKTNDV